MPALLAAITAACNAYAARLQWERRTEIERLEDEILTIGIPTSPALKLRIDLLVERKRRKLEQVGTL
jgi:hypothetical protein